MWQGIAEHADDSGSHRFGKFVEPKIVIGPGQFLQKELRIDDAKIVGTECTRSNDSEIAVAHHDRIRRAPLVAGEESSIEEVDVGLERGLEAGTATT